MDSRAGVGVAPAWSPLGWGRGCGWGGRASAAASSSTAHRGGIPGRPRARSSRAPPRAPPPPRSAPLTAAARHCHWCPAMTRAAGPGGGRRGGRARGAADETRAPDASRAPHFIHSARAGVSGGSTASGALDHQLSVTPASDPARRASARSSGSPADPLPRVRPVQLRLCPTERPSVQPWLGRLSSDGPARILPPCQFGECPACRVRVTFVGWGGVGGSDPGAAWGRGRAARGPRGSGGRWHSRWARGPGWQAGGLCARLVPMRLSQIRSPFCFPEGAAWCMMQHPVSKRGRPGASGWVPRVPCLALGAGTHRWSRGRSGWVDAHRTRRASGRPSLTWRTTEHPTPPRGPQRVIGRASGASPGGDAGWSCGRWPVGDGSAHPARWPRRPPLFLPGTPGSSLACLHLLPGPPRWVT